ncbi:MAG: STAS domain-containing protein [Cyanobacteria bacterium J06635_1]
METDRENNSIIIQPEGSVDINSSDALRREILDGVNQGSQTILIDCQDITFMDSSGLSAMVMALKLARDANIRLALCSVSEQASLLFRLTGMDKVFEIFEHRAAFEQTLDMGCQV